MSSTCSLCEKHIDNQELSFQCQAIRENITVKGEICEIYEEDIPTKTIKTLTNILEFREKEMPPYLPPPPSHYILSPLVLYDILSIILFTNTVCECPGSQEEKEGF